MAAHSSSSSGLKDLFTHSPPPISQTSSSSPIDIRVVQKLKKLTFDSQSPWASPPSGSSSSSPSLPFSISLSPTEREVIIEKSLGKGKLEDDEMENNRVKKERADIEARRKKQSSSSSSSPSAAMIKVGERVFPPPITCLKKFKTGKPYAYLKFDEESESYALEEIKIPNRDLFCAARENGRLKLYLVLSDEEEE